MDSGSIKKKDGIMLENYSPVFLKKLSEKSFNDTNYAIDSFLNVSKESCRKYNYFDSQEFIFEKAPPEIQNIMRKEFV